MAVHTPTLITPSGPDQSFGYFKFRYDKNSDQTDAYDLQISEDQTFADVTLYNGSALTAGINLGTTTAPYVGPTPSAARQYWWRARGRAGATIGGWSRALWFTPDPRIVAAPYTDWAGALLAQLSTPRPLSVIGTLLPTGSAVTTLAMIAYMGRIRLQQTAYPPATDRVCEVLGMTLRLDYLSGWMIDLVTHDLPG